MSLRTSKTRRQKRIIAETISSTNSLRKSPKTPLTRKALQNLQPSSDSPKVLVGSAGSVIVKNKVKSKVDVSNKITTKQNLTSNTENIVDKENAALKGKLLQSDKSFKKSILNNKKTIKEISRKSNLTKQSRMSDFAFAILEDKKEEKLLKEEHSAVEQKDDTFCENTFQQGDEFLTVEYKAKAEQARLLLMNALKRNESLHNELNALESDNANLKEIVEQILEFRHQLQEYQEEQLENK